MATVTLAGLMVFSVATSCALGDFDRRAFFINLDAHVAQSVGDVRVDGARSESVKRRLRRPDGASDG